ncbi:MAG: DUF1801 domain-containing protein [Planctomycetota bacterium]
MVKSNATTVSQYLASLPADRRKMVEAVRKVIKKNLGKGFAEGLQYGMLGYFVPHSVYPDGYHCDASQPVPFVSVASQKNNVSIYLFCLYVQKSRVDKFVKAWKATGKRLDMGKSCVRVKKMEDMPLEVIGDAIKGYTVKQFLEHYQAELPASAKKGSKKRAAKKKVATKTTKRRSTKKKVTKKKTITKKKVAKKTATKKAKRKTTKKTTKRTKKATSRR